MFSVPAGSWEYKAALNDSWDENYGLNAQPDGPTSRSIWLEPTDVKFYYDDKTHWVTDNVDSVIAVAPGSFQSELGCSGDWDPGCLRSWLEDPDGDGIYSFATTALPAGSYETKVAINEAWDENYGEGGAPNGATSRSPSRPTTPRYLQLRCLDARAYVDRSQRQPGPREAGCPVALRPCAQGLPGDRRNTTSKVWYTVANGVLSDVYYPTIDNTNVETLQYIVTDGSTFTDLQVRDMTSTAVALNNGWHGLPGHEHGKQR